MGWLRYGDLDDTPVGWSVEHEGFVQLVVREDEGAHWLPVTSSESLGHGDLVIDSDELVFGVWSDDRRRRVREYRVQVACACGWSSQLLPVPLGTSWAPCSLILDERDEDAARDLWGRFHRDHVAGWPASLTQAWPRREGSAA
jgi:hypothetical protein